MPNLEEFKELLSESVKECLANISEAIRNNVEFGKYENYPNLAYLNNQPYPSYYHIVSSTSPENYKNYLNQLYSQKIDQFEKTQSLINYIAVNDKLFEKLIDVPMDDLKEHDDLSEIGFNSLKSFIFTISDRYIQTYNTPTFEEKFIEDILQPYLYVLSSDKLKFDLYIPILNANFEEDDIKLNHNTSIVKLDEKFQTSRIALALKSSNDIKIHLYASHALVFNGLEKDFNSMNEFKFAIYSETIFPIQQINLFFASLKLTRRFLTGYSQLLIKPVSWNSVRLSFADLIPLTGKLSDAYHSSLNRFKMINDDLFETIKPNHIRELTELFNKLESNKNKKIKLAIDRYNSSLLREDRYDIVIDLCIALEALLSDGSRSETTHKLAMRVATLSYYFSQPRYDQQTTLKHIKFIYDYRSAIVHGDDYEKVDKKFNRMFNQNPDKKLSLNSIAFYYVENTIKVLLDKPEFLKPNKIDEFLVSNLNIK